MPKRASLYKILKSSTNTDRLSKNASVKASATAKNLEAAVVASAMAITLYKIPERARVITANSS